MSPHRARLALSDRLAQGLLSVLALTILAVVIPLGIAENQLESTRLRNDAAVAAERLAVLVSGPLWDVDTTRAAQVARAFAADQRVASVVVREEVSSARVIVRGTGGSDTVTVRRDVMHDAQRVGTVEVSFDRGVERRATLRAVIIGAGIALLAVVALLIGGRTLLRRFLDEPLDDLSAQVARYGAGDYTDSGTDVGYGELREFSAVLRAMGRQITGQLEALRNTNAQLTAEIDERRRAEARLALQGAAMDATANAIVITDAEGIIEYANPAFTAMTGYTLAEARGRQPGDLLKSGKHATPFYRELWGTIRRGRVWKGQIINRRKDGTLYTEEMTITPVRDARGETAHYVAVKEDVTRRLALEAQFRQSQKMESVGRLVGGVAHDFNNMLGVIIGHADLAINDPGATVPTDAALREILTAAQRSAALTRQLLTFARRQDVAPQVVSLNASVTDALKMLSRMIGEHVSLRTDLAADVWPVLIDRSQVDQLLANLCVNARDAISDVGSVTISTRNISLDAAACAGRPAATPGDYVELKVADTGCGIDDETLQHIFEPFFTTKGVGEGTGLGLATVYGIVAQNRGFIEVTSQLGVGTCFHIHFPRHDGAVTAVDTGGASAKPGRQHETILVVEDEPMLLRLAVRALETLGYTVLEAEAPEIAVRLVAAHQGRIDLLLTDLIMPGMNGRDLATTLRDMRPAMDVLFMSGFTGSILDAYRDVIGDESHFIAKPFTFGALGAKVRALLDGAATI